MEECCSPCDTLPHEQAVSSETGGMTRLEAVSANSRMLNGVTTSIAFGQALIFKQWESDFFGYFISGDVENRTAVQKTGKLAVMSYYRHTRLKISPQLQKSEVTKNQIKDSYSFLGLALHYKSLTKAARRAVHFNEKSEWAGFSQIWFSCYVW